MKHCPHAVPNCSTCRPHIEAFRSLNMAKEALEMSASGYRIRVKHLKAVNADLLEALQKIVIDEENRRKDLRHDSPAAQFCDKRLGKARAAIAKATKGGE